MIGITSKLPVAQTVGAILSHVPSGCATYFTDEKETATKTTKVYKKTNKLRKGQAGSTWNGLKDMLHVSKKSAAGGATKDKNNMPISVKLKRDTSGTKGSIFSTLFDAHATVTCTLDSDSFGDEAGGSFIGKGPFSLVSKKKFLGLKIILKLAFRRPKFTAFLPRDHRWENC